MSEKKVSAEDLSIMLDEDILKLRFKNISWPIAGTDLEKYIEKFYSELQQKGLKFKPKIFLGDEWFSPEGMNAISIPFYLSNTRLKSLEKTMMLEVEGGDEEWFMKLLRHEAGHCFDHCYKFSKRKKWETIFGSPNEEYQPDTYRPQPYSKSFVKHLDRWYAQAHPDEDFAETFAVWLNPNSDWRKEYSKWPKALIKLEYIDVLAKESLKLKDLSEGGSLPSSVAKMSSTLEKYYQKRRKENADEYPDFYDSDLKKIFNGRQDLPKRDFSAARFIHRYRKNIVATIAWSTQERKFTIDSLIKKIIIRCENLDLKLGKPEVETTMEVASFITSLVKNYLFTGKFKREV